MPHWVDSDWQTNRPRNLIGYGLHDYMVGYDMFQSELGMMTSYEYKRVYLHCVGCCVYWALNFMWALLALGPRGSKRFKSRNGSKRAF